MASATFSLCASLSAHCSLSQQQNPFSLSASNHLSFLSTFPSVTSPHKLSSFSPRLTFSSYLPKSSASETLQVESEADGYEPEAAEIVQASEQSVMREQIFAVVMIGSRQYIVFPGRWINTQRLKGATVNDKITLNKVLLVGTKTRTYIGYPIVTNAVVHAIVEEQGLDDKVLVFKYKKKKNYQRNIGHRQPITRIRITSIAGYEGYPSVINGAYKADLVTADSATAAS